MERGSGIKNVKGIEIGSGLGRKTGMRMTDGGMIVIVSVAEIDLMVMIHVEIDHLHQEKLYALALRESGCRIQPDPH